MLKNKEKGKRRKLYHFNQFIKDYTYYNYARFEYNGHKGYIYYLDEACEKDLCETVKKYDNTEKIHSYLPVCTRNKASCIVYS